MICCYVELADASKIAFDRYRGGETLAYIGWPTVDGSGGTDVGLQYPIGISAITEYTDGCWEFVKEEHHLQVHQEFQPMRHC